MTSHNLDKPIWINEYGVPAWDDYPGPVWEPLSPLRASQQEQADYAIQSAFHAISTGADALFHFQLYDGRSADCPLLSYCPMLAESNLTL